jgi:hypothetical protein
VSFWGTLALAVLIVGIVADSRPHRFNAHLPIGSSTPHTVLTYNVRTCLPLHTPVSPARVSQCAAKGAGQALKESLGLGALAFALAWTGVVYGTGIACSAPGSRCAVLGCGRPRSAQRCVALSHGLSLWLLISASVCWGVDFLFLAVFGQWCAQPSWSMQLPELGRAYSAYGLPFGLGTAASLLAALALLLQIPALLRANRATLERRQRLAEVEKARAEAVIVGAPAAQEMVKRKSEAVLPRGGSFPPPSPVEAPPPLAVAAGAPAPVAYEPGWSTPPPSVQQDLHWQAVGQPSAMDAQAQFGGFGEPQEHGTYPRAAWSKPYA